LAQIPQMRLRDVMRESTKRMNSIHIKLINNAKFNL